MVPAISSLRTNFGSRSKSLAATRGAGNAAYFAPEPYFIWGPSDTDDLFVQASFDPPIRCEIASTIAVSIPRNGLRGLFEALEPGGNAGQDAVRRQRRPDGGERTPGRNGGCRGP